MHKNRLISSRVSETFQLSQSDREKESNSRIGSKKAISDGVNVSFELDMVSVFRTFLSWVVFLDIIILKKEYIVHWIKTFRILYDMFRVFIRNLRRKRELISGRTKKKSVRRCFVIVSTILWRMLGLHIV